MHLTPWQQTHPTNLNTWREAKPPPYKGVEGASDIGAGNDGGTCWLRDMYLKWSVTWGLCPEAHINGFKKKKNVEQ